MSFQNVAELKSALAATTPPRLGRFGEKIYALFMQQQGHTIEGLHKEKADFKVQDLGRVDVKTRGFGSPTARTRLRVPNTIYCFVDLHASHIVLTHEDSAGRVIRPTETVDWEQALAYWNDLNYRLTSAKSELKERILLQTDELRRWIEEHWKLKAAVVYREGRATQESMTSGKNPWGPITFYEWPTAKRFIDLKVLAYFDGDSIYQIMAYPIDRREEIDWKEGRTKKDTKSFDPKTIHPKFVFADIQTFKQDFPKRFL
jgi:hypothetical protein